MWKSVYYEAQGRSHVAADIPCQDKTLSISKNGVDVIALADGAGSAKWSHFGAETVIQAAADYMCEHFASLSDNPDGRKVKLELLEQLTGRLGEKRDQLQCEMRDLASTLLIVAVRDSTFIMVHIGDGVIGYIKDDELKVASSPENGEFANTTTFVTSSDAAASMRLFKGNVERIAGFVLMSDGTAESLYHKQTRQLVPALRKIMHRNSIIAQDRMLALIKESFHNVIVPNTQDDCSIAIMSRNIGGFSDYESLSASQKCELLQIEPTSRSAAKRVKRYDMMLGELREPRTAQDMCRLLRLKPRYTSRHLNRLLEAGLIVRTNDGYRNV